MLVDLEGEEAVTIDKVRKESLQWKIIIIKQDMRYFPKIEILYEDHRKTTLLLLILKFEHDMHLEDLMPQCPLD